jgi:hypothetical protein
MRLYRAVVNRSGSKDDRGTVGGSRAFRVARRRGRKREHESPAVSIAIIGQLLGTIVKSIANVIGRLTKRCTCVAIRFVPTSLPIFWISGRACNGGGSAAQMRRMCSLLCQKARLRPDREIATSLICPRQLLSTEAQQHVRRLVACTCRVGWAENATRHELHSEGEATQSRANPSG